MRVSKLCIYGGTCPSVYLSVQLYVTPIFVRAHTVDEVYDLLFHPTDGSSFVEVAVARDTCHGANI